MEMGVVDTKRDGVLMLEGKWINQPVIDDVAVKVIADLQ